MEGVFKNSYIALPSAALQANSFLNISNTMNSFLSIFLDSFLQNKWELSSLFSSPREFFSCKLSVAKDFQLRYLSSIVLLGSSATSELDGGNSGIAKL